MSTPALYLALPCKTCGVAAGIPCVRRDGKAATRQHKGRTPAAPCGSYGGYQRHKRARETPCDECREANRRYMGERRRTHPEEYARDLDGLRAVHRATQRLVDLHRDEWKTLVAEEKAS